MEQKSRKKTNIWKLPGKRCQTNLRNRALTIRAYDISKQYKTGHFGDAFLNVVLLCFSHSNTCAARKRCLKKSGKKVINLFIVGGARSLGLDAHPPEGRLHPESTRR